MTVDGSCVTSGPLRIEGTVRGDVASGGLELVTGGAVEGDITLAADSGDVVIVIGGRVAGSVRGRSVQVTKDGVVLGGIEADEATIHGRVSGGLVSRRRLSLSKTAVVEGDVSAERLSMEEGGQVNGTIRMGKAAEKPAAKRESAAA